MSALQNDPSVNTSNTEQPQSSAQSQDWNSVQSKNKQPTKQKNDKANTSKNYEDFLEDLLDRFVNQQDQISKYRSTLTKWFAWITAIQLIIVNVLIFIAIFGSKDMIALLDFLKYFVGATFLELLGGLLIIVKYVFSHETSEMIKHLTYVDPNSKG